MQKLLREAMLGLVVRGFRGMAFLIVCSSLVRRTAPPDRMSQPPPVATQPVDPIGFHDRLMKRSAAEIETAARVKLGWPD